MAVSTFLSSPTFPCSLITPHDFFPGRHRGPAVIKEEPKSPAKAIGGRKRKAYSTINSDVIGTIEGPIDIDFESAPSAGKRVKTAPSGEFDGVILTWTTRQSAQTAKVSAKKGTRELFKQLSQQFGAVAKTCEDIADTMQ